MNPSKASNISSTQRRKQRSILSSHRQPNIRFQPNEKPNAPINEKASKTNSTSMSITNMPRRPLRKSALGTRGRSRNRMFPMLPDTSFRSPKSIKVESNVEKCSGAYDGFETNETFMMADVSENEVTVVEMAGVIARPKDDDAYISGSVLDILNVTDTESKVEDSTLSDLITLLNSIIENNTHSINRYLKQIDEIKNEVEEKNRQTKGIFELKSRLVKKFNLNDNPNQKPTIISSEQTTSKSVECSAIVPYQKDQIQSSSLVTTPSKKIIHELRSTIKFLKTPRSSKCARKSILLTPHSMSFCIESQLEKLLE